MEILHIIVMILALFQSFFDISAIEAEGRLRHPSKTSICRIDYRPASQSLEISMSLFVDDLDEVLRKSLSESLDICGDNEHEDTDILIEDYFEKHLKFTINKKKTGYSFVGKECKSDVIWCYLEITEISTIQSFKVLNDIMIDVFPSQSNIMHYRNGDVKKSFRFTESRLRWEL